MQNAISLKFKSKLLGIARSPARYEARFSEKSYWAVDITTLLISAQRGLLSGEKRDNKND